MRCGMAAINPSFVRCVMLVREMVCMLTFLHRHLLARRVVAGS